KSNDGTWSYTDAGLDCDWILDRFAASQRHWLDLTDGGDWRRRIYGPHRRIRGGSRVDVHFERHPNNTRHRLAIAVLADDSNRETGAVAMGGYVQRPLSDFAS